MQTLIDHLYQWAPVWVQNCMVSAKGAEFRYRRSSDQILKAHLAMLDTSQYRALEQFREEQMARFRDLLRIAFNFVPYYRDMRKRLGCEPGDFRKLEDVRRLPMLCKADVRGNERHFVNESALVETYTECATSGTTGTPLRIYEPRDAFARRWAFVARLRGWAGLSDPLYPRRAQFTGRNIVPPSQSGNDGPFWRSNYPGNSMLFSTTHIGEQTVRAYAVALRRLNPELIDGYPSALLALSRLAGHVNLPLPKPKAIIVSAETLFSHDRAELEAAFGCRVFNQYAASEPSCFWCDCEYGVMHENPEYGISEIVDETGCQVAAGSPGEVVVTSFLNPAMILLRYRLGDLAIRSHEQTCECGRFMPRISEVLGRADDILFIPDRGYIGRLDPVFKGIHSVIEAQIVQESMCDLVVKLVPAPGYDSDTEDTLKRNLRAKVGNGVHIRINIVAAIPRGPNGKFKAVKSNIKDLYPPLMRFYT